MGTRSLERRVFSEKILAGTFFMGFKMTTGTQGAPVLARIRLAPARGRPARTRTPARPPQRALPRALWQCDLCSEVTMYARASLRWIGTYILPELQATYMDSIRGLRVNGSLLMTSVSVPIPVFRFNVTTPTDGGLKPLGTTKATITSVF